MWKNIYIIVITKTNIINITKKYIFYSIYSMETKDGKDVGEYCGR